MKNTLIEHCTLYGLFDVALPYRFSDGPIILDHCAILRTLDDGYQVEADTSCPMITRYCYLADGPLTGLSSNIAGTTPWAWHHNVIDSRAGIISAFAGQRQAMLAHHRAQRRGHRAGLAPTLLLQHGDLQP